MPALCGMKQRACLRSPAPEDEREFLERAKRSRALHGALVRAPSTPGQFAAYVASMQLPQHRAFLVCQRDTAQITGVVNISHMVLGAFRGGYLAFYAFTGFERKGLMRKPAPAARHGNPRQAAWGLGLSSGIRAVCKTAIACFFRVTAQPHPQELCL
jgi:hypothetical protein